MEEYFKKINGMKEKVAKLLKDQAEMEEKMKGMVPEEVEIYKKKLEDVKN